MGRLTVNAEFMRLFVHDDKEGSAPDPFTGAVRIQNTASFGKPMPIAEGIALYKKKILEKLGKADLHIGLGNIYRTHNQFTFATEHYQRAIAIAPFYIEAHFGLAEIAVDRKDPKAALHHLEQGRPFLKRPVICRNVTRTPDEVVSGYITLHSILREQTGSSLPVIRPAEVMDPGKHPIKIGRNEPCPCGSGKKYKKCCLRAR